ncbi:MAG TPA: DUF6541 family protein [Patescibacteria group bacterium]|nr:DUF6541 family protein [Patescibacteria group bacterium]
MILQIRRLFSYVSMQKQWLMYVLYFSLSLAMMLPLLRPGYVFAVDMVFTPTLRFSPHLISFENILAVINFVLPSEVIQKILLVFVPLMSGIGMHRLLSTEKELPKYVAGVFYMWNPFVYSRFLYGHLPFLIGYALFPFALRATFHFFEQRSAKTVLWVCLWLLVFGIVNVHVLAMFILFFIVAFFIHLSVKKTAHTKNNTTVRKTMFFFACFFTCLIIILYWANTIFSENIQLFNQNDLYAFQTTSDETFGTPLNVLALYGFWGDTQQQYVVQKEFVPFWSVLAGIILILVFVGCIQGYLQGVSTLRVYTMTLCILASIAFVLSFGIAWEPIAPVNQFLYDHFPLYYGFREPQKFILFLCVFYAFSMGSAVQYFLQKLHKHELMYALIGVFCVLLPFIYSPGLFWGFHGQLYTSQYPSEWYEVNEIFKQDQSSFRVLFFPWHMYMYFDFTEKKIANPASHFFDADIIAGDNMEINGIESHSTRMESRSIEQLLEERKSLQNGGKRLQLLNIKYILVSKNADYSQYIDFLDKQNDLRMIYDNEQLKLYKNTAVDNPL